MILSELCDLYERLAAESDGLVPEYGWSLANVSWEIDIDTEGRVQGFVPLVSDESRGGCTLKVPWQRGRSSDVKPYFLCDTSSYLLDVGSKRWKASRELHLEVLKDCAGPTARALRGFFEGNCGIDSIQVPAGYAKAGQAVFRVGSSLAYAQEDEEIRAAWNRYWPALLSPVMGRCSVLGVEGPIAMGFPKVYGIADKPALLVSCNEESFTSYGASTEKEGKAKNAWISEKAAFEAGEALRYLFRDDMHNVRIGDGSLRIVFWADRPSKRGDSLLLRLLGGRPKGEDRGTVEMVHADFDAMRHGRPLQGVDSETRYNVVGITPDSRMTVRFSYTDTLGSIAESYGQYLRDIGMVEQEQSSLGMLLRQTAVQGKWDNVPDTLLAPCFSAMLRGERFPASLLSTILSRMRADRASNNTWDMGQRASLIKACLLRNWRYGMEPDREGELTMALNRDNENIGYLLGRLFAVMERAQSAGIGDTNATIRDRYIGAAASTPARVFPQLFHGLQNSLTAARKRNPGLAVILERELDEIVGTKLEGNGALPTTLGPEDQGEFYVGYYQERTDLWKSHKKPAADRTDQTDED